MSEIKGYVWDDRAPAYLKSGDLAVAMATEHYGLDIDATTHQRWRQLMGLMREVDTWADDTGASPEVVQEGLRDFSSFKDIYPALAPGAVSPETSTLLLRRTAKILQLGRYASTAASAERFVALRIAEARESVNLFDDVATDHVRQQADFERRFMPGLRALGEAATLWDSLVDGKSDWRKGNQVIKPNPEYYAQTTKAMLQRTKLGGAALLHVKPLAHLGVKGIQRAVNRLQHGIPEYSTLRLFHRQK
jgi:hypothetical protein